MPALCALRLARLWYRFNPVDELPLTSGAMNRTEATAAGLQKARLVAGLVVVWGEGLSGVDVFSIPSPPPMRPIDAPGLLSPHSQPASIARMFANVIEATAYFGRLNAVVVVAHRPNLVRIGCKHEANR
jgi:hypothetical protein